MTAARVCIIAPPGYPHSKAFLELAMLLKCSCADLGIACDYALNQPDAHRVNILLGYHLLRDPRQLSGVRYIPWQLEQLSEREGVWSDTVKAILQGAAAVWDYSADNVAFLRRRGIAATIVPPGFHPALRRIPSRPDRDIDVLFYGSVNERRQRVLRDLSDGAARVKALFGAYGAQRDEAIGRAKIVVNIHHYAAAIFESVRISYLLNNGCFVVSEESAAYPYEGVELCMVPYDQIAQTCRHYLQHDQARRDKAQQSCRAFEQQYPMVSLLSRAIDASRALFA